MALWTVLGACLVLALLLVWTAGMSTLHLRVDPDLAWEVDWNVLRTCFAEAGVGRVEVEVLPDARAVRSTPGVVAGRHLVVGLVLGRLESERVGLAAVDPEALAHLLWRHREVLHPGHDASALRRGVCTAAAIRQVCRTLCADSTPPAEPTAGEILQSALGRVLLSAPQAERLRRCFGPGRGTGGRAEKPVGACAPWLTARPPRSRSWGSDSTRSPWTRLWTGSRP